ncbi:hypothetical protein GCM10009867_02440 [Pedococcus aerophilus]|uniref:Uncharacterized protein n=1 Tax=Pedococcus aerophilus TaxID=436356 RepID=A0ABN3UHA3_9MICO
MPQPGLHDRGDERRRADHADAQHHGAERRAEEPRLTEQRGLEQRRRDLGLHPPEHRQQQHGGTTDGHGGTGDARPTLRQGADEQGQRRTEQDQTGQVDATAHDGAGGGDPAGRRRDQDQRDGTHDAIHLAPPGPDVQGGCEQRPDRDAQGDAGAPDRRGVPAFAAGRIGLGEQGQPAREHRRSPGSLDEPPGDEDRDGGSRCAGQRAEAHRGEAQDVGASPPEAVAEDPGREQDGREADAHRAEHPGPADRADVEVGGGGRHAHHRRDVGDEDERRPPRDQLEGTVAGPREPTTADGWRAREGSGCRRAGQRYWPVLATLSIERPGSVPLLPVTSVRM